MKTKNQVPQNVRKALTKISSQVSQVRLTNQFKAASVQGKADIETVTISLTIANCILDMTLQPEAGMFYETELRPLTDSIVSALNEAMPIAVDDISTMVYPLWYGRHMMCAGLLMPWEYLSNLDTVMPKPTALTVTSVIALLKG